MKTKILVFFMIFTLLECDNNKVDLSKLDTWNQIILEKIQNRAQLSILENSNEMLSITILMSLTKRNISKLEKLGLCIRSINKDMVTAEVPVKNLQKLTSFDFIKKIKINTIRHLASSLPDSIESPVIIGIIDTELSFNPDLFFDTTNHNSRLLALWDQSNSRINKNSGGNNPLYGIVYYKEELKPFYCTSKDTLGHGGICLLLAAGNYSENYFICPHFSSDEYIKTNTPIVVVNTTRDEGDIIDGINYIKQIANKYKVRCVINLSYGKHNGAHDGSSLLSQAINNASSDSCLIVVASGNDGLEKMHNQCETDSVGKAIFCINHTKNDNSLLNGIFINSFYEIGNNISISLKSPEREIFEPIAPGFWKEWNDTLRNYSLVIANGIAETQSKKNEIQIVLMQLNKRNILPEGNWEISFSTPRSSNKKPCMIDSWIVSSIGYKSYFNSYSNSTASDIACGNKAISVGGYNITSNRAVEMHPGTGVDTSLNNKTPNMLAPVIFCTIMKKYEGTSFSAPVITRLIAKVWEKYPHTSGNEIYEFFENKTFIPDTMQVQNLEKKYQILKWSDIDKYFVQLQNKQISKN